MRRTVLLLASIVLAVLFVSGVALVTPRERAQAAFPGKNGKITFVRGTDNNSEDREIYVMSAQDHDGDGNGDNLTRLTNNTKADSLPGFSPDGERVAFTSRRDSIPPETNDEIYVMSAQDQDGDGNGDNLTRLTNSPLVNEFQPAFSPDGQRIAFTRNEKGSNNNEVYVMNSDGTEQVRLTKNVARDARPAFSPDGKEIAFTSNRTTGEGVNNPTGDDEIFVMDAMDQDGDGNGDKLTQLTHNLTSDTHANFSPDGKALAFTSNNDIYLMNSEGIGDPIRLTDDSAVDEFPAFSPDGKQIVFSSNREARNYEIYVKNTAPESSTNKATRLTYDPAIDSKPDWGPLLDTTPPAIALTTPADGAAYTLGQQVNVEYSCQDEPGGSGLASCVGSVPNGDPINTTAVGPKTFTVEATDNAGNTASKSHSYRVLYDFGGFYEPVNNLPATNMVKAGSAVPVKFGLGGDQGLGILVQDYPKSQQIDCDTTAPVDILEQTATAGESGLSYDAATDQYTYVWKTGKSWKGTCRQLVLMLDDTTVHRASFTFK